MKMKMYADVVVPIVVRVPVTMIAGDTLESVTAASIKRARSEAEAIFCAALDPPDITGSESQLKRDDGLVMTLSGASLQMIVGYPEKAS